MAMRKIDFLYFENQIRQIADILRRDRSSRHISIAQTCLEDAHFRLSAHIAAMPADEESYPEGAVNEPHAHTEHVDKV